MFSTVETNTKVPLTPVLVAALFAAGCATTAPNDDLQKLQDAVDAKLATKADKAEVAQLETRVNKASEDARSAMASVGKVITAQSAIAKDVGLLGKAVGAANSRLDALEKQVVGVRAISARVVGRIGALEDTQEVDYKQKLLRLSGFPTAKLNDKNELTACAEISEKMQARIAEIAAIIEKGWEVTEIGGFADERPFIKGGKVVEKSDKLNAECAEKRAGAVAEALEVDVARANGRGVTTKFGGHDVNRSALIYLKKLPPKPAPKPAAKPVPQPATAAPATAPATPAQKPAAAPPAPAKK